MARMHDTECREMRAVLLDLEDAPGSGRVRLDRFHRTEPLGIWRFSENLEFLRDQKRVDESDPGNPMVAISNYICSRSNCLQPGPSPLYSICCIDQCVPLLQRVEQHTAAPTMEPKRVLELVSSLTSETLASPRSLSSGLSGRLEQIAARHGEAVPLHNRLFAQGMHHAFPNECPYPYEAGRKPVVRRFEKWLDEDPGLTEVNNTAMSPEAGTACDEAEGRADDANGSTAVLPWTEEEELLGNALLRVLTFGAAMARGFASLRRALRATSATFPLHLGGGSGKGRHGGKLV